MPFANSLSYGTIHGGPFNGALGFNVEFSGNGAAQGELADAVIRIRTFPQGKRKLVRVSGDFTEVNEMDVLTFVKSLKDSGYDIHAISDGQLQHSWFPFLNWLIVEVGDELWPGFICNELHYKFSSASTGEEPAVLPPEPPPMSNQLKPFLYVMPIDEVKPEKVIEFIKSAKREWGILSRKRFFMEVT